MSTNDMKELPSRTGTIEKVWQIEIQTQSQDVGKIINGVMEVDPLIYGRYQRNAFVSAVGSETYLPQENSTSAVHLDAEDEVRTFPSVLVILSIPQHRETLGEGAGRDTRYASLRRTSHFNQGLLGEPCKIRPPEYQS